MSSSSSNTDSESYQSNDSDWNYIPGNINLPTEGVDRTLQGATGSEFVAIHVNEPEIGAYANEPEADEEWLAQYLAKKQTYDERMEELKSRLDGIEEINTW